MAKMGSIEIDIEVDDKKLQSDINNSKKKLEKFDKDTERLTNKKATLEIDEKQAYANLTKIDARIENIRQKMLDMERINIPERLEGSAVYKDLQAQMEVANIKGEEYLKKLELIKSEQEDVKNKTEETKTAREQELQKVNQLTNQAKKYKQASSEIDLTGIKDQLTEHESKLSKIITKVGKWALAIFGVRSAYNFVRQSASLLSQYNKKMATDIEYIRWALAMTLKPVIEKIIELVYKLLYYINYIAKAWFGINLFANASAKAFKKATGGLKSSNKEAKKLEKTLAGFDEMNILSDNKDSSAGAGGDGGFVAPSVDLAGKKFPIPKWVQWLADNKELVLGIIGILTGALVGGKLLGWLASVGGLLGGGKGILGSLTGISKLVKLGIIAGGIVVIAGEVKKWYEDTEKLKETLNEINEEAPKQVKKSIEGETDINKLLKMNNTHRKNANNLMGTSARVNAKVARSDKERLKTLENTVLSQDQSIDKMKELYDKGKLNTDEQKLFGDEIYKSLQYLYDIEDEYEASGKSTDEIVKKQKEYKDLLYQINPELAKQKFEIETSTGWWKQLVEQTNKEKGKLKEISLFKIGDKSFSIKVKSDTTEAFKSISNFASNLKTKVGNALNNVFKNIGLGPIAEKLAKGFGNILGPVYGSTRETIDKLKYKFKGFFASKGAIINMPGRGVPVMAGERGQEGIVPLSDSAQMEMLGQMIGKYININATINTNLDGRTIARKVEQIQNESNFALNR